MKIDLYYNNDKDQFMLAILMEYDKYLCSLDGWRYSGEFMKIDSSWELVGIYE